MRRLHLARPARYIPALRFDWLTPLYDPLLRRVMGEERFKRILVAQAGLQTGQRALDLGCGTGTLTIMLKRAYPGADVVGLDGDPRVLEIARRKAAEAGVGIAFDLGMAFDLPYLDNSFDRVVSSLVLHHLVRADKPRAMHQALRVLKPGGEFHLADFGKPASTYGRLVAIAMRRFEEVADNLDGRLPEMMRSAGFQDVVRSARLDTVFGTLEVLRGVKAE